MAKKNSRPGPTKRDRGIILDGDTLRLHRKARSAMTQEDFARFARIPVRSLQRAESEQPVDAYTHDRIARAYGVPAITLVKVDATLLTPPSRAKNTVRKYFEGYVDLDPEMVPLLDNNRTATAFFLCLQARELIKDGALDIRFRHGSIIYSAYLSSFDIRRIVTEYLRGSLREIKVVAIKVRNLTFDELLFPTRVIQSSADIHPSSSPLSELARAALERAAKRITSTQMNAFRLSVLEGRSTKQTADQLSISPATVLSARRRIMKMIKDELASSEQSDAAIAAALKEPATPIKHNPQSDDPLRDVN